MLRVRGRGVPSIRGGGKGDLHVQVRVLTPTKLNKRQRELLAELGGSSAVENKPEPRSLFEKVKEIFG
jgi:molecular chaperone DnaJ